MTKLLISAAALITLLVVTDAAFAAGASRYAPGPRTLTICVQTISRASAYINLQLTDSSTSACWLSLRGIDALAL